MSKKGSGRKYTRIQDVEDKIIRRIEALGPEDKYMSKAQQDELDYLRSQLGKKYSTNYKNKGGSINKKRIGANDYRSGGMVLNSVDNRKSKS